MLNTLRLTYFSVLYTGIAPGPGSLADEKWKLVILNKLSLLTVIDKVVLVNSFDEITICSLFKVLFKGYFKL